MKGTWAFPTVSVTSVRDRRRKPRAGSGARCAGFHALRAGAAACVLLLGILGEAPALAVQVGTWGHGSWCWFADPRAVRVSAPRDMTFVGWLDWSGRVKVGAYDAASEATTTSVVGWLFHDDHGSPSIMVEPDKRLTVFWSAHNGHSLYFRTSRRPEDISAWGRIQTVPVHGSGSLGFTYPNPVLLSSERNKVYLFWRGARWAADDATRKATGGWSPATDLVANHGERPYLKVDSDGRAKIGFAFTEAHPRDALTSIYYMGYQKGWLRHANGRLIARMNGRPVAPRAADMVYDARATGMSAWVWDVAIGESAHPVIVYATFPSARHHHYWYARWTGRAWFSHFLTDGGPTISPGTIEYEYSGGLARNVQ